ncbi:MAG: hypothetical protein VR64_03355 [Desulfatitalea sp. BRH_c12]|nr:MAG: hypothetical protein VR64_03355 [Desulfatitalea sp. BRH_c12]
MTDKKLLTKLAKLGFPLFEPNEEPDVNETLAQVVVSHDARLWEGFPVLLANASETYQFTPELVVLKIAGKKNKDQFHRLMLLSGALFSYYHLSFAWWNKLKKGFSQEEKNLVKTWKSNLATNQSLKMNKVALDAERLKGLFELYFEKKAAKDRRRTEKYEEFSLEYALSNVFSPKQKELFKKKLEGLPLTKTEQEYYSRAVKKKVVALANSELHSLSKKLLGL